MEIIIKENGENNVTRICFYNPNGISYDYRGKTAKYIIQILHESLK
jgi:hypothetical protein|tara:strand:- start:661 stop:798 length:138 start_codon:yes stop_codon:yes gene_type:complete